MKIMGVIKLEDVVELYLKIMHKPNIQDKNIITEINKKRWNLAKKYIGKIPNVIKIEYFQEVPKNKINEIHNLIINYNNEVRHKFDKYGLYNDEVKKCILEWTNDSFKKLNQKILDQIFNQQLQFCSKNKIPL